MTDITNCPSCNRKLQLPDSLIGQDVQCPGCGATFVARAGGRIPPPLKPSPQASHELPELPRQPNAGRRSDFDSPHDDIDYDSGSLRPRRDLAPHHGALILTLGILGLFLAVPAPIAWILGNTDVHEIRTGRMDPEGEGVIQAGRICGVIGSIAWGFIFVFCCCGSRIR